MGKCWVVSKPFKTRHARYPNRLDGLLGGFTFFVEYAGQPSKISATASFVNVALRFPSMRTFSLHSASHVFMMKCGAKCRSHTRSLHDSSRSSRGIARFHVASLSASAGG